MQSILIQTASLDELVAAIKQSCIGQRITDSKADAAIYAIKRDIIHMIERRLDTKDFDMLPVRLRPEMSHDVKPLRSLSKTTLMSNQITMTMHTRPFLIDDDDALLMSYDKLPVTMTVAINYETGFMHITAASFTSQHMTCMRCKGKHTIPVDTPRTLEYVHLIGLCVKTEHDNAASLLMRALESCS